MTGSTNAASALIHECVQFKSFMKCQVIAVKQLRWQLVKLLQNFDFGRRQITAEFEIWMTANVSIQHILERKCFTLQKVSIGPNGR